MQRIKAVPTETKLLVVDSETDEYYSKKNIVIVGDMPDIVHGASPDQDPSKHAIVTNGNAHGKLYRILWTVVI